MNDLAKLRGLQDIAALLRDARLAEFQALDHARRESLARLEALNQPSTADGLSDLAAAEVAVRYQKWADLRRAEINQQLARQTSAWLEARSEATRALGRADALKQIAGKVRGR